MKGQLRATPNSTGTDFAFVGLAAALAEFPAAIEQESPPLDISRFVPHDDEDFELTLDEIADDISHALGELVS